MGEAMKKIFRKKAFSIAEIIISMALIAILSIAGYTACYLGLNMQNSAAGRLSIWNIADGVRVSFERSFSETGVSSEDEGKRAFLIDFNDRLAFALNSYVPNLNGFEGDRALDGDAWEIALILEEEISYVPDPDGTLSTVRTTVSGLNLNYFGADQTGPTYTFEYIYFTSSVKIDIMINIRTGIYYLTVRGYHAGSDNEVYKLEEMYS